MHQPLLDYHEVQDPEKFTSNNDQPFDPKDFVSDTISGQLDSHIPDADLTDPQPVRWMVNLVENP